jgi:hypothetical protein
MQDLKLSIRTFMRYQCGGCHTVPDDQSTRSKCRLAKYCNQKCQRAAWPEHKSMCRQASSILAAGGAGRRSFSALAVDCTKATRCLELLLAPASPARAIFGTESSKT